MSLRFSAVRKTGIGVMLTCTFGLAACVDSVTEPPGSRRDVVPTENLETGRRPSLNLPFGMELTMANLNSCETQTGRYASFGTFRGWTKQRRSVTVNYADREVQDTVLKQYSTIGFDRKTKRSTDLVTCVLRKGPEAEQFIAGWPSTTDVDGFDAITTSFEGFDGNVIWCEVADDEGYVLSCNGNTCTYGEWATLRAPAQKALLRTTLFEPTGVPGWGCGNGCTIYFLLSGNFAFWCPGNEDLGDPNVGNGSFPADFTCVPTTVSFNQSVNCTLVLSGHAVADDTLAWNFKGDTLLGNVTVDDTTSIFSWTGNMITSGVVSVRVTVNGILYDRSASVTVSRRSGWTWYSNVGGVHPGSTGEIDSCFPGNGMSLDSLVGLTATIDCATTGTGVLFKPTATQLSDGNGLVIDQVAGGGPNKGLWYISSATIGMDLRTQVLRHYRADGPTHTIANVPSITSQCQTSNPLNVAAVNSCLPQHSAPFNAFIATIWSHEKRHLDTATVAAREPAQNVKLLWESLVHGEKVGVLLKAKEIHELADARVFARSSAVDMVNIVWSPLYFIADYGGAPAPLHWYSTNTQVIQ